LEGDDEYSVFQCSLAVYHDDVGDYSTNEPTIDGTASCVYYFASMVMDSQKRLPSRTLGKDKQGHIKQRCGKVNE